MFAYTLPQEFGWVLLSAVVMGLSCLMIGFIFAGGPRGKIFSEQYMKENFGAEHQRVTGQEIKKGGYPDTGSGFYTRNLNYEQWYQLNNGQRAHMNFIEWIAANQVFLIIGGLYFPIVSAVLGFGISISRFIYAIGYSKKGPDGRLVGALMNDLIALGQIVMAVIAAIKFINGDSS